MDKRLVWTGVIGGVVVLAALGAGWVMSLPVPPATRTPPAIAQDEIAATLAALKPPKRARPLIVIVGVNEGTEVTDYLMPYGILRRADVADVLALSTKSGTVKLYSALQVESQGTLQEFDAQHADGADYVIVPAMYRDDDPIVLQWLKSQSAKGATIIAVCAGAKVVAEAGLLDGKRATTHWYYVKELLQRHPTIRYVPNRRIVADRGVVTTTGISASMPMALTLIEAIAGREKAESVGRSIGLAHWDARHDSSAFLFSRPFALTVIRNTIAFWNRERLGLELQPGMDEVSLALVADMWSRTYRSKTVTFADSASAQPTRGGLRIVPDEVATSWPEDRRLPPLGDEPPANVLDDTLRSIADRYGLRTAEAVGTQLEYPGSVRDAGRES